MVRWMVWHCADGSMDGITLYVCMYLVTILGCYLGNNGETTIKQLLIMICTYCRSCEIDTHNSSDNKA